MVYRNKSALLFSLYYLGEYPQKNFFLKIEQSTSSHLLTANNECGWEKNLPFFSWSRDHAGRHAGFARAEQNHSMMLPPPCFTIPGVGYGVLWVINTKHIFWNFTQKVLPWSHQITTHFFSEEEHKRLLSCAVGILARCSCSFINIAVSPTVV